MDKSFGYIVVLLIIYFSSVTGKTFAHVPGENLFLHYRPVQYHYSNFANQTFFEEKPEFKSKTRARLYSVTFTSAPLIFARLNSRGINLSDQTGTSIALLSSGILFGPSAGSIYANDWELARNGIFIRTGCSALLLAGHYFRERLEDDEGINIAGLLMQISGGVLLTASSLYDIIFNSAHSVEYHNARVRMEAGLSVHPLFHGNEMPLPGLKVRLSY